MFFILRFHTASKIKAWFIRSSKIGKNIYFSILNYAYVGIEKLKQELLYLT